MPELMKKIKHKKLPLNSYKSLYEGSIDFYSGILHPSEGACNNKGAEEKYCTLCFNKIIELKANQQTQDEMKENLRRKMEKLLS